MSNIKLLLITALAAMAAQNSIYAASNSGLANPDNSVVLIRALKQEFDYVTPWKRKDMKRGAGSGFVIDGQRILTNAHNISNYRYIELVKEAVAKRYPARVVFVGHDCDLAIIAVDDKSFFEGTTALELAGIPKVNSTVSTYGFPVGGDRISVTEGVVSRIEADTYAHSAADDHLVIQTDAAINPGNSGGPVVQGGKVVGVAFQGLREAENIGYLIPTTVIDHFLIDIEDGRYDGFGSMGAFFYPGLHNSGYKDYLKVSPDQDGIVVIDTLMHSSVESVLQPGDVMTKIDDYNIDNDGMIQIYGLRLSLSEAIESKQIGETLQLVFSREGELKETTATIALNRTVLEQSRQYDNPPPYVCFAGLVFVPVTRNYLESWGPRWPREVPFYLRYLFSYSAKLNTNRQRKEYIVLSEVMSDEVNAYANEFKSQIVESINGLSIHGIEDIYKAFKSSEEPFYTIRFMGNNNLLRIDGEKARQAHQSILIKYDIPAEARLETKS